MREVHCVHYIALTHAAPVIHQTEVLFVDRQAVQSTVTAPHLKRVFYEHISSVSAAESQRTRRHKDLSGSLIMMNPIVGILIFGIHIRTQQQMTFCSNLAAAV